MKPIYKARKWQIGKSFGWWNIPFCGKCKRQLGLLAKENKIEKCPMCGEMIDWSVEE